ncbi:MAG: PDZ domain-containing protein, partial [Verrucomicrobiae bacterium]|nr:PDZ domain-containing protein [Verrucomicrobiae bacterium]
PAEIKGVLITDVQPGTSVASAGLQSGDVILEINRHAVSDTDSAIALCKEKGDGITLLRVWRAGATRYVVVNEKPVS